MFGKQTGLLGLGSDDTDEARPGGSIVDDEGKNMNNLLVYP